MRKKITETKSAEKAGYRGRAKSNASSDNATVHRYPIGPMPVLPGQRERGMAIQGVLEPPRHQPAYYDSLASDENQSSGSRSGSSIDLRMQHPQRPTNEFVYIPVRRPTIRTDDVSGIEKSGLRSALDKKSDEVRKGLVKAFTFKKDTKGRKTEALDFRPESSATVRPSRGAGVRPGDATGPLPDVSPVLPAPQYRGFQQDEDSLVSPARPEEVAPLIKRWVGAGRPVQRWNKLRKDPELWDPNGDVLVFLGQKGLPRPHPSFRLSSHIIEATESRYLITLLREGLIEEHSPYGQHLPGGFARPGEPTPPVSEDNSLCADGDISYEMYFPTPPSMTPLDQLRHQITTRNVFALLYHASLVGLSLHQTLSDLHSRLKAYMPPGTDNIGSIINYLSARGLDVVRNDPEAAVGLLAWSGGNDVRWEEGWCESFLHCAGMYSRLEACADFDRVTPITRALLERASLEAQLRVQAAEERLAGFEYGDMWPAAVSVTANASGPVLAAPAKAAADRLQRFFVEYYTKEFGSWPPQGATTREQDELWLTRTVARLLQRDFAALYDYLVDRGVIWDESEARPSRKWMMVAKHGRQFEADTPDVPMTDMLIEFDNKHRFPHIPHPYPLVPCPIPSPGASVSTRESPRSRVFGSKPSRKNSTTRPGTSSSSRQPGTIDRRIQLAYTEATNLCLLGSEFTHSSLVDAFARFEKGDCIGEIDPSTARRGRWVLIYGILQTLASVSVDAPGVRYAEGVEYHLSVRFKGAKMPPWKGGGDRVYEAAHELSHCWVVPGQWMDGGGAEGAVEEGDGMSLAGSSDRDGYDTSHFPILLHGVPGSVAPSLRGNRSYRNGNIIRNASSSAPSVTAGSTAPSVLSYSGSDTASNSAWSPRQGTVMGAAAVATAEAMRRGCGSRRSAREAPVVGGIGGLIRVPVEERDWAVPVSQSGGEGYDGAPGCEGHGAPGPGYDDFLVLDDDDLDVDEDSFAMGFWRDGDGQGVGCGPGMEDRGGSRTDAELVGPVIRDFDELGVIDVEDGYVL